MASAKNIYDKKVSNATKVASFFIFLSESYFLLDQFNFKCNLKNPLCRGLFKY